MLKKITQPLRFCRVLCLEPPNVIIRRSADQPRQSHVAELLVAVVSVRMVTFRFSLLNLYIVNFAVLSFTFYRSPINCRLNSDKYARLVTRLLVVAWHVSQQLHCTKLCYGVLSHLVTFLLVDVCGNQGRVHSENFNV